MRRTLSALLFIAPLAAFASQNGISGYSGKTTGMNCGGCHSGATAPTASIVGAPASLNVTNSATVTVVVTAGTMATTRAGLNVALGNTAAPGSTLQAGTGTQIVGGELTHTAPQMMDAGITSFTFGITAGTTNGPLTIYIAANAVNGDGATTGDNFYLFNRTIQITGSVPDAGQPDAGQPADDGGTQPIVDSGVPDAGPAPAVGRPGGFVDGDIGCSTGGGLVSSAWLLVLGALGLSRRKLRA
jgi:hypothetical protein